MSEAPKKHWEMKIHLSAHSEKEMEGLLRDVLYHWSLGEMRSHGACGGGYWWETVERPEITEQTYNSALEQYLRERKSPDKED